MTLTVGSLFSGIGGIDLGLQRTGMTIRWQCEIDDYCRRVLAKHWPDVPKYGDIKELTGHELETVDLIAGGFPCQPVSLAGKRLGQSDDRWLWPELIRIVRVVRPRFVLLENVPGLLVRGLSDVLGDLAASGYDAEWDCLPAAAVGAPHLRDRIFIVAYARCLGVQQRRAGGNVARTAGTAKSQTHERQWGGHATVDCRAVGAGSDALANSSGARWDGTGAVFAGTPDCSGALSQSSRSSWWATEPDVGRVAYGVPARMDRLRGLGNAVVPAVVEHIGRRIVEVAS